MSSVARRSASKAACFLSLIAGVTAVPASAQSANLTLVPAITTLTGTGTAANPGSSPTLASSSADQAPIAVVVDTAGNVYFSDQNYNVVWKITRATGIMAIFAGQPGSSGSSGDGGPATSAKFNGPQGLKFDSAGNLYIVDSGNFTVRRVDHVSGNISTVAGTPGVTGSTGDSGLATSAKLVGPSYIAFDGLDNLYIADASGNSIRRVDAGTHDITTVAGDPTSARAPGQTGDGGLATSALLHTPHGLSFDKAGNLYIADQGNNAVRRIDATTGFISTVAGDSSSARASGSTGDGGLAANSLLNAPFGVNVDTSGNLFIADSGNSAVREIRNDQKIYTVAGVIGSGGFSGDGGAATLAQLSHPADVALDTDGNLFLADNLNATVRDVNLYSSFPPTAVGSTSASQNLVLHLTGTLTITAITVPLSQGGSAEYAVGAISGAGCSLGSPITVTSMAGLDCILPATFHPAYPGLRGVPLLVATIINSVPKTFDLGLSGPGMGPQIAFTPALITTVAGNGTGGSTGNGGLATNAELNGPFGLAADFQGSLYISDQSLVVRRVDGNTQNINGFAGNGTHGFSGDSGPAILAELNDPTGLNLDSAGDLYLSDSQNHTIREVNAGTGDISTVAGTPGSLGYSGDGSAATSALLHTPWGQAFDKGGNLYIADSNNKVIRRVDAATGIITTVAGNGTNGYSGDGGPATSAELSGPEAVVFDAAGNFYLSDDNNNVIRKVTANTGIITTIAGIAGAGGYSGDGGPATSALLYDSEGLALDAAGNLYITDSSNNLVREVNALTGIITTVAGSIVGVPNSNDGYSGDNGPANAALLNYPVFPAVDSAGNLYITDDSNNRIRKMGGVAPLSFGSIAVSTSSTAQDVTITNNGTANLTLTALTPPADFNLGGSDTTCNSSTVLAPSASCVLGIEFSPTVIGALNETLTITDNQGSQTIPLSGFATALAALALSGTPSPAAAGASVVLTATVSGATGIPTGTVSFYAAGVLLSSVALNGSGTATYTVVSGFTGETPISAVYSGDATYMGKTAGFIEYVGTPTTVALSASAGSLPAGSPVTLTATVTPNPYLVGPPQVEGEVIFNYQQTVNGVARTGSFGPVTLNASGSASWKFYPGAGSYSITATFRGTDAETPSVSPAQTVSAIAGPLYGSATTLVSTTVSPGVYNLDASVTGFGQVAPSGLISFSSDSIVLGTAALDPSTLSHSLAAGSPIVFAPSSDWVTYIVSGDVNGDGIPDLVTGHANDATYIAVQLGVGDGTFGAPTQLTTSGAANSIAIADVNGDGFPDLIATETGSNGAFVFLGSGNGAFGLENQVTGSMGVATFVVVTDLNGDGILDLAMAFTNGVLISLGNGDGTFLSPNNYVGGSGSEGLAVADFNHDGVPDVIVSNGGQDTLSLFLGVGDGTLQSPTTITLPGANPTLLTAADLRRSGTQDIVVTDSVNAQVYVLLGNNDGTFQPAVSYPIGAAGANQALVADVTNDGIPDLVVAGYGPAGAGALISVLPGLGGGAFGPKKDYPTGTGPISLTFADFNGDGLLDIATADEFAPGDTVYLQQQTETASLTNAYLVGAGNHNVLASFPGDASRTASQSAAIVLTGLAPVTTTTTMSYAPNPAYVGQTVTFTASIVPVPTGTPFGVVAFYNGAGLIGTAAVNAQGVATFVLTNVPANSGTAHAVYSGNASSAASTSASIQETITLPPTTTAIASSSLTPTASASVTLTATVTPAPTGSPLGSVSFYNGSTLLGTGTVNGSGVATFSTTTLPVGTDSITAAYSGNAAFSGSTSTAISVHVNAAATTSLLTVAPNPVVAGQSATFTLTISPAPTGSPLGTVSFHNGGTLLGTATVNGSGVATFSTTTLPLGNDSITAAYSGNAGFAGSTSTAISVQVNAANATATSSILTVAPNPVVAGQSATFTLTITPAPTGSPLGTVSFHNGGTLLGTATVNGSGVATFSTTVLPVGTGLITGSYSGNAGFAGSTSAGVSLQVNAANATATSSILTVAPNPVVAGQSATFTLTISPAPTGSPLGTVSFHDGGTLLGTATVNGSGVATFSTTALPVGTGIITGSYSGNAGFAGSTSAGVSLQVNAANATATVTTITSSSLAPTYGQSVALTATITPAPSGAPLGTVSFYAGTNLLGAQALNAQGIATLSVSLPLGSNAITAVYSGSAGFATSTSSALSVSARALSAITVSASPTTQLATMPIVFTAQVNSATAGIQTGTVSFLNGSTVMATVTVVPGQPATYSETGLASGLYSVTASYSGDGNFLPSASSGAPVSITVSDLDLAIGGDNNQSVVPGGAVTYNFPLSPVVTSTFLYNVVLTATGLPAGATYTFSPASIPAGSGTLPVAFTVQTAKTTAMLRSSRGPWFALVLGLLLPLAGVKRFRARLLLFGALGFALVAGLDGCGSGGFLGTPPGKTNYTITIVATSGTLVRTSTVQLNLE